MVLWLGFFTEEGSKHPPWGRKMTLHTRCTLPPAPPPLYITEQRGIPPLLNPETNIYCGVIKINISFGFFNTELKRHAIGNYKWFMCVCGVCVCQSVQNFSKLAQFFPIFCVFLQNWCMDRFLKHTSLGGGWGELPSGGGGIL